jgi:Phosphopantetheine attachment site
MGNFHGVLTADPADGPTSSAECERRLAEVLADIVGTANVSVDSHFFADLGADSMLMARFCARVRKRPDLPSVSMPDIYKNPTIQSLATALANTRTNTNPTPASRRGLSAGTNGIPSRSASSRGSATRSSAQ